MSNVPQDHTAETLPVTTRHTASHHVDSSSLPAEAKTHFVITHRAVSHHADLNSLPAELHLFIVSFLDLKSLIKIQGVSKYWRSLVRRNKRVIYPPRLALLRLYKDIINAPWFLPSRPHILPLLEEFSIQQRQRMVDSIQQKLPVDFELWILEWPGKATISSDWPSLRGYDDPTVLHPPWWKLHGETLLNNEYVRTNISLPKVHCTVTILQTSSLWDTIQDNERPRHGWNPTRVDIQPEKAIVFLPALKLWNWNHADSAYSIMLLEDAGPLSGTVVRCGRYTAAHALESELMFHDADDLRNYGANTWLSWLRHTMLKIDEQYKARRYIHRLRFPRK